MRPCSASTVCSRGEGGPNLREEKHFFESGQVAIVGSRLPNVKSRMAAKWPVAEAGFRMSKAAMVAKWPVAEAGFRVDVTLGGTVKSSCSGGTVKSSGQPHQIKKLDVEGWLFVSGRQRLLSLFANRTGLSAHNPMDSDDWLVGMLPTDELSEIDALFDDALPELPPPPPAVFGSPRGRITATNAQRNKVQQSVWVEQLAMATFACDVHASHLPSTNLKWIEGNLEKTPPIPSMNDASQTVVSMRRVVKEMHSLCNPCDLAMRRDYIDRDYHVVMHQMNVGVNTSIRLWALLAGRFGRRNSEMAEIMELMQKATVLTGVDNQAHQDSLREMLISRFRAVARGRAAYRRIRTRVNTMTTRRKQTYGDRSLLLETLTTVDLVSKVVDNLSYVDALRLMIAFRGARVNDKDVRSCFKRRLPRLHIYQIPDLFPHAIAANGDWLVFADIKIHVAVGFGIDTPRQRIREANPLTDELTGQKFVVSEADYGTIRDPAYSRNEGVVNGVLAAFSSPDAPWHRATKECTKHPVVTDPNLRFTPVNPREVFIQPPRLSVTLVYADSYLPVVPNDLYGGLRPDNDLRAVGGRVNLAAPLSQPVATVFRMWPTVLSSKHFKKKFRIIVRATGVIKGSSPPLTTTITSETPPIVFLSNHRVAATKKYQ